MGKSLESWRFAEGDPITGELTAVRRLGGGEAYDAYLAFDEITYSPVVVKIVRPDQVDDGSTRRGLRREVEALTRINHPAVVRGLRSVVDGERPHVVLEQLDGPRLSSLIRRHGPLQPQQYLPLAIEVAAALHYFATQGYVHLDVKPSNIIMGAPAKLIDLSVARPLEAAEGLTYPVGTDAYMSPEQCDPPHTGIPGYASDVWGLGATLYEATTGYKPFDLGDRDARQVEQRFPQLVDGPYTLPGGVPSDVAKTVLACLDPDPGSRPVAREVADALEPAMARLPKAKLTFKVR